MQSDQAVKVPIVELYGENAVEQATQEIEKLKQGSNIPFDIKYVKLGISFLNLKASDILIGNKKHRALSALVSESFGEAAICKYNLGCI